MTAITKNGMTRRSGRRNSFIAARPANART
jgi:hypothetical protein